jgi:putative transposase
VARAPGLDLSLAPEQGPTDTLGFRDVFKWLPGERKVRLQGIGCVKVNVHRAVQGVVKTISVKREGRRWYLVLSCDGVPAEPLAPTGAVAGIDMGLTHFASTSDGAHIADPRHGRASAERLATAQQALSRAKRGSNRRRKAAERVAACHRKVRNQCTDFAHKTALALVRNYDLIAHEALRVANMSRSASGTIENPGTNVAAKSGLNRSIADAGWSAFLAILTYKAESAGRLVIAVEPANTSRTCAECGHCARENRSGEAFRCLACGHTAHADVNAAVNILRAGLARQAAQAA